MTHPALESLADGHQRLNHALAVARTRVESASGGLVVDVAANGTVTVVHVDDSLASGRGRELAAALTALIGDGLIHARADVQDALDDFTSDDRVIEATEGIRHGMSKPLARAKRTSPVADDEDDDGLATSYLT